MAGYAGEKGLIALVAPSSGIAMIVPVAAFDTPLMWRL